jgi:hypothetical protein
VVRLFQVYRVAWGVLPGLSLSGYYIQALSPGLKQLGHEADHSPSRCVEVQNAWTVPPLHHVSLWHGAQLKAVVKLLTGDSFRYLHRIMVKSSYSLVMSICVSVSPRHRAVHQMNFNGISDLGFLLKFVSMFWFWLKLDKNNTLYMKTYINLLSLATIGLHNWDIVSSVRWQLRLKKQ